MTRDEAVIILQDYWIGESMVTVGQMKTAVNVILSQGYAPEGKVIVPREPTEKMLSDATFVCVGQTGEYGEYNIYCSDGDAKEIYRAMLSAAEKETGQ